MSQRSPIIFWLLLMATICVDAVAIVWMSSHQYVSFAEAACDALFLSQLSFICIWSALASTKNLWSRLAPLLAVIVASLVLHLLDKLPISGGLPYYGLHAALLLTALWLFERTTFWRRRSGATTKWRYSVAHLLIAMTIVAVLAAAMRNSQEFYGDRNGVVWKNIAFICGSVALAVVSVVSWSMSRHWLIRCAGVLGFALLLGAASAMLASAGILDSYMHFFVIIVGAHFLIQAVVISAWLGCSQVLPTKRASAVADG